MAIDALKDPNKTATLLDIGSQDLAPGTTKASVAAQKKADDAWLGQDTRKTVTIPESSGSSWNVYTDLTQGTSIGLGNLPNKIEKLSSEIAGMEYDPGVSAAGLAAPVGKYDWETQATERAKLQHQQDVLTAKQNALTSRQTLEESSRTAQSQFAMAEFESNQSIDKAGWTGGYVLDSTRQMNILRESLKAEMYAAEELQRYGFETSLEAARLSYDMKQFDLALEYYNTAFDQSIAQANLTGYLVLPEVAYSLNQYSVAVAKLEENPNDTQAQSVLKAVEDWFAPVYDPNTGALIREGISKTGMKTLAAFDTELKQKEAEFQSLLSVADLYTKQESLRMQRVQLQQTEREYLSNLYQAQVNALTSAGNTSTFVDRNYFENGAYKTVDWGAASDNTIYSTIAKNPEAETALVGYLKNLVAKDVATFENLNIGANLTKEDFQKAYQEYMKSNSSVAAYLKAHPNVSHQLNDNDLLKGTVVNSTVRLLEADGDKYKTKVSISVADNLYNQMKSYSGIEGQLGDGPTDDQTVDATDEVAFESQPIKTQVESLQKDGWDFVSTNPNNTSYFWEPVTSIIDGKADVPSVITKQNDYGKADVTEYLYTLANDIKNNKVPAGSVLKFNLGGDSGRESYGVYLGNGKVAMLNVNTKDEQAGFGTNYTQYSGSVSIQSKIYVPAGYKINYRRQDALANLFLDSRSNTNMITKN